MYTGVCGQFQSETWGLLPNTSGNLYQNDWITRPLFRFMLWNLNELKLCWKDKLDSFTMIWDWKLGLLNFWIKTLFHFVSSLINNTYRQFVFLHLRLDFSTVTITFWCVLFKNMLSSLLNLQFVNITNSQWAYVV